MDAATALPRPLAATLREALADTPVVCLLGPRQCGKTTLALALGAERGDLSLGENRHFNTASEDADGFVARLPDRVILDEVQRVPALLTASKRAVYQDRRPGAAWPPRFPTFPPATGLAGATG